MEPQAHAVRRPADTRRKDLYAAFAVVLATGVRVWFLLTPAAGLDGDEAVTGIMARRMAGGRDLYTYFLGQHYNGALEQYPQALLFRLGLPVNAFTLRIPQVMMAAATCWLIYRVGLRMLKSPSHALMAAALFAVGPYFLIWEGARSKGSYDAELLIVVLGLLFALRLDDELSPQSRGLLSVGFGLCFGITYWLTPSGYYIMIPAGLWFAARAIREWRALCWAAAGALLGLSPVLYWTAITGSFPIPNPGIRPSTKAMRLHVLLDPIGREFLGVAHLGGAPGWPMFWGRLVVYGLLALAAIALIRRARGIISLITLRKTHRRPFDVILLALVITIIAYIYSPYGWSSTDPRYLFVAFPILILGLIELIPIQGWRRTAAAGVVFAIFGGTSLTMLVTHADSVPPTRDRDLQVAADMLVRGGVKDVYAEYWTAMPLEFFADDRLNVGTLIVPDRLLDERRLVDAAEDPAWVAGSGVNGDDRVPMRNALTAHGIGFRERRAGSAVSIFDRFSRPVRPWEIGLGIAVPAAE